MRLPRIKTIQTKFFAGLCFVVFFAGVMFTSTFYLHMREVLETEVEDKAHVMFNQIDAVKSYVRNILRPIMYEKLKDDTFIIEAMSSSYISRAVTDIAGTQEDYIFRRVAINSRNPVYEANTFERQLIFDFRRNPTEEKWSGFKTFNNEEYYVVARPVVFNKSCMRCHGNPEDAPKELIERYGNRGFHRKVNIVSGIDMLALPISKSVTGIRDATLGYTAIYIAGAIIFFGLIQLFFNRLVVGNIRRLSNFFKDNFPDEQSSALLEKLDQGDEIDEMIYGMEQLGSHLNENRRQLKNYAANLEIMVAERTREVTREAEDRQTDVNLLVRMISSQNESLTRTDLWKRCLPLIASRFHARQIGYVCTYSSKSFYAWPDNTTKPELPENWLTILTESMTVVEKDKAYIPVESSKGNTEGMLCIYWNKPHGLRKQDKKVLRAIGRQLGVAAENISALDNIMRQKAMLQAVFEGIRDPLIYLDSNCAVLTANEAARRLTSDLSDSARTDGNILLELFNYRADLAEQVQEALATHHPLSLEVKTSEERSFSISIYPIANSADQTDNLVAYVRDNTIEKMMLTQIRQHEKMATVGKLAAGLAHEMNNPLGVILCYVELLKGTIKDQTVLDDVDVIKRHATQAQRVLGDLLKFARPKTPDTGPVDINAVVKSNADVFSVQAEKQHIEIKQNIQEDLPHAHADQHGLEQVLTNLILNALDAISDISSDTDTPQGQIVITTGKLNEQIFISISDTGCGIVKDDLKHIFDPFFSTKDVDKGTGLGLAVVYGLIHDMGGNIEAQSKGRGHGSIFTITLNPCA
ncbi:MAG: c-type heme family protein [Desulfovibrio sp.]